VLRLRPNPKLIDSLRARSRNGALRIVAFKLTHGEGAEAADRAVDALFAHSGADWVVQNDLALRGGPDEFPSSIHFREGGAAIRCGTRPELAAELERILSTLPSPEAALAS
jgi:hypothetical protein